MPDLNATIARCLEHMERIERDPKIDPVAGDVLKRDNRERRVIAIKEIGYEVFVRWNGPGICNPQRIGAAPKLSNWRKWSATAEVIKRGDA